MPRLTHEERGAALAGVDVGLRGRLQALGFDVDVEITGGLRIVLTDMAAAFVRPQVAGRSFSSVADLERYVSTLEVR